MGIALQDRSVHIGAGIALIGIAYDDLFLSFRISCQVPFSARWKSGTPSPSQSGGLHLLDDLLGRKLQGLHERGIPAR